MSERKEVLVLVKRVLDEATFTMRHVADYAGLTYQSVRRWKAGARAPDRESRLRLAAAFDVHARKLQALAEELRREAGEADR